jgi:hypothetical protein
MAYGLQVFGGNNVLQIDSSTNLTGFSGYTVTTSSSISVSSGDLVFCRHSPSSGNIRYFGIDTRTSTWTAYSRLNSPVLGTNSAWQPFNLDWLILRSASTAATSGTYGLQVKNAANQVAFDSRALSFGFSVTGYLAAQTASGNPFQDSGPIAPLGEWISIEHGFLNPNLSNDPTNPISIAGLAFANNRTEGYSVTVNGAYYFGVVSFFTESFWGNFSDIITGESY